MSHAWHILFEEDRIKCDAQNDDIIFGWTPCFEWTWNNIVNTYEITVFAENVILALLCYYVLRQHFRTAYFLALLNTGALGLALYLGFASVSQLNDFQEPYNIAGFAITLTIAIIVEYRNISNPYRGL